MVRVQRDAVHGADLAALRFVKVAHAFGAFVGVDFVDLRAGRDGAVGAFAASRVAIAEAGPERSPCTGMALRPWSWMAGLLAMSVQERAPNSRVRAYCSPMRA